MIMMKDIWKLNLVNDELPLNKMIETPSMIIVVNKYYLQVFLDEGLYKFWII